MGVLGSRVLEALAPFGFPLRGWSRSPKQVDGVECFHGADGLDTFLRGSRVLVCMLPLTPDTSNMLDRSNMSKLPAGIPHQRGARRAHGRTGSAHADQVRPYRAATLDVFRNEPLPRSIRSGRSRASPSRRIFRR
jgi:glyoxylate/hydroxypyruvate reductase A